MRELIKLCEGFDEPEDPELAKMDARMEREKKIEKLIRHTFGKLGLGIADERWSVSYEEDAGREAVVVLDDEPDGWPLAKLVELARSGLAKGGEYSIRAHDNLHVAVHFIVDPMLDQRL